jgi:glycosyltransferase involved in cell wall biosynthesis
VKLSDITVLILSFNEEANIGRILDALQDFPEIVVIDSGSTDGTIAVVRERKNARLVMRAFDDHAKQWNFGLSQCNPNRPFVLALDADYRATPAFVAELKALEGAPDIDGYRVSFRYCVHGEPLRGSLYPPVVALFRRSKGRYVQTGHTQRLVLSGGIANISAPILHDDRKTLSRWISSQARYARLEAAYLLDKKRNEVRLSDRLRLALWPAPLIAFVYTLIVKGCVFDGWRGWYYALQRLFAETLISLELVDRKLKQS